LRRQPPDLDHLFATLEGVKYVVTGSVAALLLGVPLEPGDLDIAPELSAPNLTMLAAALDAIDAHQDPEAPFGRWERQPDGQHTWVEFEPTAADLAARAGWRPDPAVPDSFDHLLESRYGAIDIVPWIAGTYDVLRPRAGLITASGHDVWVEHIDDQLATLTVPRRPKDRDRVAALRRLRRTGDGHRSDCAY
jgi:hypothetical protein